MANLGISLRQPFLANTSYDEFKLCANMYQCKSLPCSSGREVVVNGKGVIGDKFASESHQSSSLGGVGGLFSRRGMIISAPSSSTKRISSSASGGD
jgi:hypothetical protein